MGEWFQDWFGTKYYHLLYQNRDEAEARLFLSNLIKNLPIHQSDRILDLACGSGRHSHFLAEAGFNVTGIDLSEENILKAKEIKSTAEFYVHDMRNPVRGKFKVVLNLFTSFGYFECENDNIRTLESIHQVLEKDGILLIDFLNAEELVDLKQHTELKRVETIDFKITKQITQDIVRKDIEFDHEGRHHHYVERVQLLRLADFERLLDQTGYQLDNVYGDYALNKYASDSNRLILVARKR